MVLDHASKLFKQSLFLCSHRAHRVFPVQLEKRCIFLFELRSCAALKKKKKKPLELELITFEPPGVSWRGQTGVLLSSEVTLDLLIDFHELEGICRKKSVYGKDFRRAQAFWFGVDSRVSNVCPKNVEE